MTPVCPDCGTENRPGAKRCKSCGTELTRACPACGVANKPEARFCAGCGHGLQTPPAAP
ncbi:double zinc ribbon domain-containing protein, partial [Aquabacterium sp. A08]|uniref:DUF7577 domain-containing protein n=1 Tax=Aquabacterium sp. A08 TaxID=2718532 RepID=UPI00141FEFA3|nr:zinc-ribbon domain-containing protein [Aquabacterium sp. A08]